MSFHLFTTLSPIPNTTRTQISDVPIVLPSCKKLKILMEYLKIIGIILSNKTYANIILLCFFQIGISETSIQNCLNCFTKILYKKLKMPIHLFTSVSPIPSKSRLQIQDVPNFFLSRKKLNEILFEHFVHCNQNGNKTYAKTIGVSFSFFQIDNSEISIQKWPTM